MVEDRDYRRVANVLRKLARRTKNRTKILSQDDGMNAPVVKPPAITSGSSAVCEQFIPVCASDPSGTSGNILEGDLTQLVERLHGLDVGQLRQLVSDLHTAFTELGPEIDSRLLAISSTVPPPNNLQDAAEERPSPIDPVGTSAFISAPAFLPPEVVAQETERPTIIDTLTPPSTRGPQHSAATGDLRWRVKRAGLLLTLSAVIASVPWALPVLHTNLPRFATPNPEVVTELDAVEPSHGDQLGKENIVPIGMATAPPAQPSGAPDEVHKENTPVEVTTVPPAKVFSPPPAGTEIEALMERGDQFLMRGDVVAARSFYERAAASGSARAATRVARTFDPKFLSQLGVVGIRGSTERAAFWYQKASDAADKTTKSASDGPSLQSER